MKPFTSDRGRSLLITGGAGFLGANFVYHWSARFPGDRVVVLDALTYAGCRETLAPLEANGRIAFVNGDINDQTLVCDLVVSNAIDTIVHFAAESHVDRSIASADAFLRANVLGTQSLLDAARVCWRHDGVWRDRVRFHHISTDEVYGDLAPTDPPFTEATPYRPNSPYSASKAASDHFVRAAGRTHGLPYSLSHCANNYGPFQYPEKLIPLAIIHALHGRALPIFGDGHQQREWIHVSDHSTAIERIVLADVAGESFNVGGTPDVKNIDMVQRLCSLIDAQFAADSALATRFPDCPAARGAACASLITFVQDRPGHDRRYAIDPTKIASELGFEPAESLETGLRRTVEWYLGNEAWWRGVMDGSYREWISTQYGGAPNG